MLETGGDHVTSPSDEFSFHTSSDEGEVTIMETLPTTQEAQDQEGFKTGQMAKVPPAEATSQLKLEKISEETASKDSSGSHEGQQEANTQKEATSPKESALQEEASPELDISDYDVIQAEEL